MSAPDRRPRVAIDLVPIHAGRGGAGGGIWSYAAALVAALDAIAPADLEIVCLSRPDQLLPPLAAVRRVELAVDTRSPLGRLNWIHRALPSWCSRHGVAILHKLATEGPWRTGRTRLVTTVQDFMAEFYETEFYETESGDRRVAALTGAPPAGERLRRRYFGAATRRCFDRSAVVLTTTACIAAESRRRFPAAADRVRTVPLGVDHTALAPAVSADTASTVADRGAPLRLLGVGAFLPHKGQHLAIAAFERLLAAAPVLAAGATLTLRGHAAHPAYHALVRDAAAASPATAAIRLADYDAGAAPRARYADADILLQLSAYEGFGLPPLEAQAAGVPVICADIPVFREVLGDGAILVRRDDPDDVAAAIAAIAADPVHRAALVRRGHANAARFSWARTGRETLDVYRELIGRDGDGS